MDPIKGKVEVVSLEDFIRGEDGKIDTSRNVRASSNTYDYDNNADFRWLVGSLRTEGQMEPITATRFGKNHPKYAGKLLTLRGNRRVKGMERFGAKTVLAIVLPELTDDEIERQIQDHAGNVSLDFASVMKSIRNHVRANPTDPDKHVLVKFWPLLQQLPGGKLKVSVQEELKSVDFHTPAGEAKLWEAKNGWFIPRLAACKFPTSAFNYWVNNPDKFDAKEIRDLKSIQESDILTGTADDEVGPKFGEKFQQKLAAIEAAAGTGKPPQKTGAWNRPEMEAAMGKHGPLGTEFLLGVMRDPRITNEIMFGVFADIMKRAYNGLSDEDKATIAKHLTPPTPAAA